MSNTTLYVGFDTETTGLLDPEHRIIEAAFLLYDQTGKKLGQYVRRWNPGRPIDPKAQAVHHIALEDVCNLPQLAFDPEGISTIQKILSKAAVVVAHNGKGFDEPFLQQEFARIGQPLPHINMFDTMLEGTWATPLGKRPNLGELCFACGIDYDPNKAHAAEYDVDVMMQAFFRGQQWGFFNPRIER